MLWYITIDFIRKYHTKCIIIRSHTVFFSSFYNLSWGHFEFFSSFQNLLGKSSFFKSCFSFCFGRSFLSRFVCNSNKIKCFYILYKIFCDVAVTVYCDYVSHKILILSTKVQIILHTWAQKLYQIPITLNTKKIIINHYTLIIILYLCRQ